MSETTTYPEDVMIAAREAVAAECELRGQIDRAAEVRFGMSRLFEVQSAARAIMAERDRLRNVLDSARYVHDRFAADLRGLMYQAHQALQAGFRP